MRLRRCPNWQRKRPQTPPPARACGFESHPPHLRPPHLLSDETAVAGGTSPASGGQRAQQLRDRSSGRGQSQNRQRLGARAHATSPSSRIATTSDNSWPGHVHTLLGFRALRSRADPPCLFLPSRHVPGRRNDLDTSAWRVQAEDLPRSGLSGDSRRVRGIVMPASRASVYRHPHDRVEEVNSFSQHWLHLFPQHSAGTKHERKIVLEAWQERNSRSPPRSSAARTDPLRRVPGNQHDPAPAEDLLLSPLLLLQSFAGHPADLLRCLRPT